MILRTLAIMVWVIATIGVFLTPSSVGAGDGLAPEGDAPRGRQDVSGIDEKLNAQLPLDLVLRDEEEKPITLRECIDGKPTILVPMYYRCPMLCNLVLKSLVETLRALPQDFSAGGKFNVVAVSFDPKEHCDLGSAKRKVVLQEYGREGAENGWRFLTGSKEAIPELMTTIGYRYEFDKSFKEYNHPSGIIILTPEGKIARYFYGITYDGEFRVPGGTTTLRLSLIEAADGKGGSMLDKLTLLCYRFEHMKGYSLSVLRAVQIGGILTLLVVGIFLSIAFYREWRGREGLPQAHDGHRESQAGGPPVPQQTNDGLPSGGSS
jgi:protein SCO1